MKQFQVLLALMLVSAVSAAAWRSHSGWEDYDDEDGWRSSEEEEDEEEPHVVQVPQPHAIPMPVAYPHPVESPRPYPLHIRTEEQVVVPAEQVRLFPVVRHVPYMVQRPVPVPVYTRVPFLVERHVPVPFYKPFPVKVPVVKYVHHYVRGGKKYKKKHYH